MPSRALLLFGASGQIGRAFARKWEVSHSLESLSRDKFQSLSPNERDVFFKSRPPTDFVFAGGLTDPSLSREELLEANVYFPQRAVELSGGLELRSRHRYLTLGSVQEGLAELVRSNPYLSSKKTLSEKMSAWESSPGGRGRFLHLRIHTVYGSEPKGHMFLGQMLRAIRENRIFEMSSGEQLREYHHQDEVALALVRLLERDWKDWGGSVLELNSGKSIRLSDLARAVLSAFEVLDLLRIGAISRHSSENLDQKYVPSPDWLLPHSRDPIQGVIESFKESLGSPRGGGLRR